MWPDLDEDIDAAIVLPGAGQRLEGFREADRLAHIAAPVVGGQLVPLQSGACDRGHERAVPRRGRQEFRLDGHAMGGALHAGGVEGILDRQAAHPDVPALQVQQRLGQCFRLSRQHHRVRRIDCRDAQAFPER